MDDDAWTAGRVLREAREARGLTQGKAARLFDVEPGAYGAWERGASAPRLEHRKRMVEVFSLEPEIVGLAAPSNMALIGSKHFDKRLDAIEALLREIHTDMAKI